jgi:hypothetical protein
MVGYLTDHHWLIILPTTIGWLSYRPPLVGYLTDHHWLVILPTITGLVLTFYQPLNSKNHFVNK